MKMFAEVFHIMRSFRTLTYFPKYLTFPDIKTVCLSFDLKNDILQNREWE